MTQLQVKLTIKKRKHKIEWLEKADKEYADDNKFCASENEMDADVVSKDTYTTNRANIKDDEDRKIKNDSCQSCSSKLNGSLLLVEMMANIQLKSWERWEKMMKGLKKTTIKNAKE